MPSTRLVSSLALVALSLLVISCVSKPVKPQASSEAPVAEEAVASDAAVASNAAQPSPQGAITETVAGATPAPVVVVETPEQLRERLRLEQLQAFGPDPYLTNAPQVPEQVSAEFSSAMALLNSGDASAEAELVRLNDAYPGFSGPAYNLAILKSSREDYKGALVHAEAAISRNPNNLQARALKAFLHRELGNFALAEKEYLDIISQWGGFLPAYRNLGILYDLYMGRITDALVYYRKYNELLAEPDKQVAGWSADIERQVMEKQSREAAAAESAALEAAAVAASEAAQQEVAPQQQEASGVGVPAEPAVEAGGNP